MGKINVLSFAVANLIAAGEVVDRPSSVIKELLENAIDSGADRITIEIQNGGVTYMRVSDNGCGMIPEDLPVAIRRHATSKIKNAEDLDGIITLGFRGEALAAIASVSDLRIISKTADAPVGAMLEAQSGNIIGVTERACSDGTTVIVENLFSNVPARRKFLKKDITESMAVSAMVEKIALSKPHIAFRLIVDGNVKLETVGDGVLKNTIYSIFGRDFASKLIEAEIEIEGIKVSGFVGRPDNVRANRNYQNFFINGRYVKSKTALAAIEQAYTSYIASEKFPCCVLFIDINPATVDVNVHPAKLEVKFSNEKPVFEAIYYSVRNALERNTMRPDVVLGAPSRTAIPSVQPKSTAQAPRVSDMSVPIEDGKKESLKSRQIQSELYVGSPAATPQSNSSAKQGGFAHMSAADYLKDYGAGKRTAVPSQPPRTQTGPQSEEKTTVTETMARNIPNPVPPRVEQPVTQTAHVPEKAERVQESVPPVKDNSSESEKNEKTEKIEKTEKTAEAPVSKRLTHRIVGEVFNAYVIVECGEKMLLIDKHAAHERIIFEQLKAGMKNGAERASQMLMLPLEVMMTSDEIQTLAEYREEIEAVGFEFTTGRYTASVTAIPEGVGTDAVSDMLAVMAERIKSNTGSAKLTRDIIFEKALYQASCKAAIKAGREYPPEYVQWIVDKLMEIPDITVCPHGRPVAMELTKKNLDYQFERS